MISSGDGVVHSSQVPVSALPDPSTVAGLGLWLEDVFGVFSDPARTIPVPDGGSVGGWTDRSASARHAAQMSPNFRPICSLTGAQGIAFDTNDSLALPSRITVGTNSTIYVVFYWPDTANKGQYIFGDGGNNTTRVQRIGSGLYLDTDDTYQVSLGPVPAGLKLLKISRNTGQVARFTGRITGGGNVLSSLGYSGPRTINSISYGLSMSNTMKLRAAYVFPSNYYADDSAEDLVVRNWIESTYGVNL